MKYKPHSSSLKETVKEVKEFNTIEELKNFLQEGYGKTIKTIDSEFYTHDSRINWDLHCINITFENGEYLGNCGFIDTKIKTI